MGWRNEKVNPVREKQRRERRLKRGRGREGKEEEEKEEEKKRRRMQCLRPFFRLSSGMVQSFGSHGPPSQAGLGHDRTLDIWTRALNSGLPIENAGSNDESKCALKQGPPPLPYFIYILYLVEGWCGRAFGPCLILK